MAVLARIRAHWVVIRHLPKLSQGVDPAAPAVFNDGAYLLVTELNVGAVARP